MKSLAYLLCYYGVIRHKRMRFKFGTWDHYGCRRCGQYLGEAVA